MDIGQYIEIRAKAKSTDYADLSALITSNLDNDIVLSSIQSYLKEFNIDSENNRANELINTLQNECILTCVSEPILQPIYGYKEVQIPTDLSAAAEADATAIDALSNVYKQSLSSAPTTYPLSDIYDLNTHWKQQFLTIDDKFFAKHTLSGSIMKASDIQASLLELMNILSHVKKFKCNVYFKKTSFTGGMTMFTCMCSVQDGEVKFIPSAPNTAAATIYAFKYFLMRQYENVFKVIDNTQVKPFQPYSWRLYISPFAKHISTSPSYNGTVGQSNSACRIKEVLGIVGNDNLKDNLIYVLDENSDVPTFDMSIVKGSNGVCTAYKKITTQTFDLQSVIDLETMFGIAPGKKISAERITSAITYIFEIWQKNLKTIQYDMYCCHYNCHANELGRVPKPQPDFDTYDIKIDSTKLVPIDGVIGYILPENSSEYFIQKFEGRIIYTKLIIVLPSVLTELKSVKLNATFKFVNGQTIKTIEKTWGLSDIPMTVELDLSNSPKYGYNGDLTITYSVDGISNIDISNLWYIQPIQQQRYTGEECKPSVVVKTLADKIVDETDRKSPIYENNVEPGLATVTIYGSGIYTGSISANFDIVTIQKNLNAPTITIEEIPDQPYTGIEIKPELTIKDGTEKLTEEKHYKVTFSNNVNPGIATATAEGLSPFYFGQKTTKFNITKGDISKAVIADIPPQTYTGEPITPELDVRYNELQLEKDSDFTVEYFENTNVGHAKVQITGKDRFIGTQEKEFEIKEPEE